MNLQKKSPSALRDKSLAFAIEVVQLCEQLGENRNNWRISDQLVRSATSIGANIREAVSAESNADFIHKQSIALKECRETIYWFEVLHGAGRISVDLFHRHAKHAQELEAMLCAAIMTMKTKSGKSAF